MCLFATTAATATTAAASSQAIATALSVAATVAAGAISAAGAQYTAKAQEAGYQYQAKLHERQAEIERLAGKFRADQVKREGARVQGAIRATYLSSGLSLSGSALDVAADSAAEEALDIQAIRFNAANTAAQEQGSANVARFNAKSAKQAGTFNTITPIIGAFGKVAGQASDHFRMKSYFGR